MSETGAATAEIADLRRRLRADGSALLDKYAGRIDAVERGRPWFVTGAVLGAAVTGVGRFFPGTAGIVVSAIGITARAHLRRSRRLGGLQEARDLARSAKRWRAHRRTGELHVHWYVYPLLRWLEILTDFACFEQTTFDIAYVTEVDPTWNDDVLTTLINPEVALFANPIAKAACAGDCAAATVNLPIDQLFWCAGCQGSPSRPIPSSPTMSPPRS